MMKYRYFFQSLSGLLLAPLLWSGCQQGSPLDEGEESFSPNPGDELVEIRLQSVAAPLEAVTRAPFVGAIAQANPLTARVLLSGEAGKYLEGSTNGFHNGSMTFDGQTATQFSTRQYYPADGSDIYLCGLYPADDRWTNYTGDATTVDFTFDGKTDVMAAAQVTTNKAEAKAGAYKELAFKHLLTNLVVLARPNTDTGVTVEDVQAKWGKITDITLVAAGGNTTIKNKVTVTMSTGAAVTATAFSSATPAVKFYKASGIAWPFTFTDNLFSSTSIDIPATSAAVAYSMIAPFSAQGGSNADLKLLVKTEKESSGIEVPVSLSKAFDTQGSYCLVTLDFKLTEVRAKASVSEWKDGGTSGGTVQ